MMDPCTFVTLASPGDTAFLLVMLRHLVRSSCHSYTERLLVGDDLPKKGTSAEAGLPAFQFAVETAISEGLIDRYIPLSNVGSDQLGKKHFGARVPSMRDHRGVPMLGWVAGIEASKTDLIAYFDSDMLLYQASGSDWIREGFDVLKNDKRALFVAPMPGPPHRDGILLGQVNPASLDLHGNWRFKTFSSRRFLVSRSKLERVLPVPLCYTSLKRRILMKLGIGNALCNWEHCMGVAIAKAGYERVHLRSPTAWTIHCPTHDEHWQACLPSIISRVEKGDFPEEQAGRYDLVISAWE